MHLFLACRSVPRPVAVPRLSPVRIHQVRGPDPASAALTRPYPPEPVRGSHPSARTAVLIQLAISIKRFPPKTFKAILA